MGFLLGHLWVQYRKQFFPPPLPAWKNREVGREETRESPSLPHLTLEQRGRERRDKKGNFFIATSASPLVHKQDIDLDKMLDVVLLLNCWHGNS